MRHRCVRFIYSSIASTTTTPIHTMANVRFLVKRKRDEEADHRRSEHVEERRADEAQIACKQGIQEAVSGKGGEQEKCIFHGGEAERKRDHVHDSVYGLVHFFAPQDGEPCGGIFQYLFDE